jgi:hypothetical protein
MVGDLETKKGFSVFCRAEKGHKTQKNLLQVQVLQIFTKLKILSMFSMKNTPKTEKLFFLLPLFVRNTFYLSLLTDERTERHFTKLIDTNLI